jgi:hypothetical protein
VTLDAKSEYETSFPRPPQGSCRVEAKFFGDSDHDPSKKTVQFDC